ncbi:MAG: bifunctional 2-polyprenyl-6-hydroxyphenol methylase/3-demethylubiquinol 3-O-methyltransferase UbiG [Hyphomicrobiales bacterium]|nr:bifunctional 2-polyprenyl-6-hydroxyphenol methylase/3-demethylubiquinol 3-O-methyltransferase UbiG [Hyphomicrobiales bacterium]MDE2114247.1 bifunctional 2-polyprenyl-6-hydroxyphenol methylase/3-demethylubiquinol 3-O-methyltransferase UbiG [Hyphomicrobiales bacterium]
MTGENTTIDPQDVARFEKLGAEWWSDRGPMAQLHKLNPVRIAYIRDHCHAHFPQLAEAGLPLQGLSLLDIGCGGGILCEPMARLGADVTGIDPGPGNIEIARAHAAKSSLGIQYKAVTSKDLVQKGAKFDVVLAMEVVEHVADVPQFLAEAAALVRPGGMLFAATLNRTMKSFALAIVGAEYVLRWVPRGTHNWSQFVTPEELTRPLRKAGLKVLDRTGVVYSPVRDAWRASQDCDVNYMIAAQTR